MEFNEDRYHDRELNKYLESQNWAQCVCCGETKSADEFEDAFTSFCIECEQDGTYLAGGALFEDAGGHVHKA